MGDFAKYDLTRADGLYPHLASAPCSGCGRPIHPEDRCYANYRHIWHSRCYRPTLAPWPRTEDGT